MDKKQKIVIAVIGGLIAAALITLVVLLLARDSMAKVGEFVAPPFDAEAKAGEPAGLDESLGYKRMDIENAFSFAMCGKLFLKEGRVNAYFTNPEDNGVWLLVKVYDESGKKLLGQSGIIKNGEYVEKITLSDPPEKTAPVVFKIYSYEPETYYSMGSASGKFTLNVQ